jgi:hypothetical protein
MSRSFVTVYLELETVFILCNRLCCNDNFSPLAANCFKSSNLEPSLVECWLIYGLFNNAFSTT